MRKLAIALVVAAFAVAGWWLLRGHNGLGVRTIVLVTLDTTRADRMGFLGSSKGLTPTLDRLASEGVVFERCLTTAPITLPAHASILTGLLPDEHGLRVNGAGALDPTLPNLARSLKERGFTTAAFVSAFPLDRRFGLDEGFDVYDDRRTGPDGRPDDSSNERRGEETVKAALSFLDRLPFGPVFLWVHLFDPHAPYEAPEAFASKFEHPYDAEVAYADWCVGELLRGLEEQGRFEDALVCVVADHGEGLGDHGESTHTIFLYDSTLRVPWLLWAPGRLEPARVRETVSVSQVAPTLLDLLEFERPQGMSAPSAAGLARGQAPGAERPVFFESRAPWFYYGFAPLRGVELGAYKLIDAPRPELYRPREDPAEKLDLAAKQPEVVERLRQLLDDRTRRLGGGAPEADGIAPEVARRLEALGYVGGGPRTGGEGDARDPKDGLALFEGLQRASTRAGDDPEGALADLQALAERFSEVPELHELRGDLLARLGRFEEAARAYARARRLQPANPELWTKEGALLAGPLGRPKEAEERLRTALALDPARVRALVELGWLRLREGEAQEARRLFDRALALDPNVVPARLGRAQALLALGNVRLAASDLDRALAEEPDHPLALRMRVEAAVALLDLETARRLREKLRRVAPEVRLDPQTETRLRSLGPR